MIWDVDNLYSDAQSMIVSTGTTNSTNTINQQADGDCYEDPPFIRIQVGTAFIGSGATIAINLVTDDDSAFGSSTTIPLVAATSVSSYSEGAVIYNGRLPLGLQQYHKLQYVVATAALTAGTITAGLVDEVDTNRM